VVWVITMSLTGHGMGGAWHSIARGVAVAGYVCLDFGPLTWVKASPDHEGRLFWGFSGHGRK